MSKRTWGKIYFYMVLATIAISVAMATTAAVMALSAPIQGEQGFSTMDQAAVAAESAAVKAATKVEEAGVIYQQNGEFFYTSPATNNDGDNFHIGVSFPKGATLVALYHTHPDHMDNDHFSTPDIQIANQLRVTSYVGVIQGERSHIIKYVPGKSDTYHFAGGDLADVNDLVSDGSNVAPLSL